MLEFEFIYTVALLVLMTIFLVKEYIEADLVIFSSLLLLIAGGVITPKEAFTGFSNHGMLTVCFLFIIAAALYKTGVLNQLGKVILGNEGSISKKLFRLLPPVSAVSAFFNNTPIVAMMIPVVRSWARKNNYSVSKFLIPLSYAAILGGTCTLIGTSTNLVVHGLMLENGMEGLSFFEISKTSVPVAVIGIIIIALFGHRLLPERKEPIVELGEETREFVIAMKVESNYPNIGKSVEEAGLRHLKGLFLFQIERNNKILVPITHDDIIYENDRLFFTGLPETIVELQKTPGLCLLKEASINLKNYDSDDLGTFEVVISPNSPLIGRNVRESNIRERYNAVIIAIHRSAERIKMKIGDVVLQSGDTLLILAKRDFLKRWYHSKDFFLVSKSAEIPSKPRWYSIFSLSVLGIMIVLMASNTIPILVTVAIAAVILILSGCISSRDAIESIDWKVLLIIASAFGIARGLDNSGVAYFIANKLIHFLGPLGLLGILAGIYFLTSFYTEVITNNAAAALMFPIALSTAKQAGIEPLPLFIAIAIAASASFATPIGYQTNLMVYGPGGYKFKDFLKIGIPMNILIGIMVITIIYFIYFA
ncbi:anion permease [candidate division KSB1 bacterium]|nr:anion permease [candidate division KSB1 bacterium]